MDNFFLSRDTGSLETGPQTFAGTTVSNTTFNFNSYPSLLDNIPGLLNSVLVQNAGLNLSNGTYNYVTLYDNKPYYVNDINADLFIIWFQNKWEIYNFVENVLPIYFSNEDVLYPWNVSNWSVLNTIYNPTPTVTKIL